MLRQAFLVLAFALALAIADTIRYEVEDAHIIGGAKLATALSAGAFSGSGFVNFESTEDASEGTVIFSLNIPEDGVYPLTIGYATSPSLFRSLAPKLHALSVVVNGHAQLVSILPSSGVWSSKSESTFFRQGLNTIMLKNTQGVSTLSVDYVEVSGAIALAGRGATLPYFEIEAESASTNGQIIGPGRDLYTLPAEASGRRAVTLSSGQWVEFTLTASANAIVVRYSIPDTSDGAGQVSSVNVLVNGAVALNLTVTSKTSWAYGEYPFTKRPGDGKAHHFYDESRALFGKTLAAGTKVRIQGNGNIPYTIDLADFYTVPAPYTQPAGLLSLVDYGADASGKSDSTNAFQKAITDAQNQGKGLWIPSGTFLVTTRFTVSKILIRGAGPWYSIVQATTNHGVGFFGNFPPNPSVDVQLYDFATIGATNVRDDNAPDSGVGGAFNGNSIVQNLWIEHTKCGMWLDGPFSNFHVTGTTIRNTYADGINLHQGISNVVVEQTILRNVGDDALAMWSEHNADVKNVFKFNTISVPILANGIAIYGGTDNSATDNYIADSYCDGGGLHTSDRYGAVGLSGTTDLSRNSLVRTGAPSRFSPNQDNGAIWIWGTPGAKLINAVDLDIWDSSFSAFTFWNGDVSNVVISNVNVNGGPYVMEVNSAGGTIPCTNVVATNLTLNYGGIHSCAGLIFKDNGGNSGWNLDHEKQHCN